MPAVDGWKPRFIILLAAVIAVVLLAGIVSFPRLHAAWHHHKLIARLQSRDAADRLNAAIELGNMGDAVAAHLLVDALRTDEATNLRAGDEVEALCRIGGGQPVSLLKDALRPATADRAHVVAALACIDADDARVALSDALRSHDDVLLQTTVLMLSGSQDRRIIDLIVDAESHAAEPQKLAIIASLTSASGVPINPRLAKILTDASNDPDAAIRSAATDSLVWNRLNAPGSRGAEQLGGATSDAQLADAATRAAAFLAARQDADGYWRTARTTTMRFEHAATEMNTYLTPVLVDLLTPVANAAGLGANLAKARRQIGSEIEGNGLVQYYGREVRPTKFRVTCTIAPDADDTALAWRIAPNPDQRLLHDVLATLGRYRAPNGLYRTWLASSDGMRCVDRGKDPNPIDIGIQMHIEMFLAQASSADGTALCGALRKAVTDNRIWVYYERASLIPMLRQPDMEKAGCAIKLPGAHLLTEIAGQGKWIAAAQALATPNPGNSALLRKLAQADFLAIRNDPPLIYQNDSTGKAKAFYWSQELGYALWLRLYFDTMHGRR